MRCVKKLNLPIKKNSLILQGRESFSRGTTLIPANQSQAGSQISDNGLNRSLYS